ncbi:MAG: hypothetical protein K9L62_15860 [Vallitaleaceae bacterium]|nr:hypothetical protein [Vallitaleaceae bacterium]
MSAENTVTTVVAREKFARSHGGDYTLPTVTNIAFGTGGHNVLTGEPIPPEDTMMEVPGEIINKSINSHEYPVETMLRVVGDVSDSDIGTGDDISACGIYDSESDLVAIKTFSPKTMSEDMTIEITWDELF